MHSYVTSPHAQLALVKPLLHKGKQGQSSMSVSLSYVLYYVSWSRLCSVRMAADSPPCGHEQFWRGGASEAGHCAVPKPVSRHQRALHQPEVLQGRPSLVHPACVVIIILTVVAVVVITIILRVQHSSLMSKAVIRRSQYGVLCTSSRVV